MKQQPCLPAASVNPLFISETQRAEEKRPPVISAWNVIILRGASGSAPRGRASLIDWGGEKKLCHWGLFFFAFSCKIRCICLKAHFDASRCLECKVPPVWPISFPPSLRRSATLTTCLGLLVKWFNALVRIYGKSGSYMLTFKQQVVFFSLWARNQSVIPFLCTDERKG